MAPLGIEYFDRGDLRSPDRADRGDAGADGPPLEVHRACTAHAYPASELRALKTHDVTNHPKQWGLLRHFDRCRPAVDLERDRHVHLMASRPTSRASELIMTRFPFSGSRRPSPQDRS